MPTKYTMRAKEFLKESIDLSALAKACENWVALEHSNQDIDLILSHPFSQQFKKSPSTVIYRAVFYSYKKFQQTGKAKVKPQPEGFISYSWNPRWGGAAREDFDDYSGDIIRFKKTLNPADLLLNFTALVKGLKEQGYDTNSIDESELWIKATPYYLNFEKSEFVEVDLGQQSLEKLAKITYPKFPKSTWNKWALRNAYDLGQHAGRNPKYDINNPPKNITEPGMEDLVNAWKMGFQNSKLV